MQENMAEAGKEELPLDSVTQEVATPETSAVETQPQSEPVEDRQERNWRAMRENQKKLEKELQMEREFNKKVMEMATLQQTQQPKLVDELDQISDDEFIPKGKVTQIIEKKARLIAQEIAQEEANKLLQKQEQSQFLDRLKRQFADFDEIVNRETLSLLEEQDPELAMSIADSKDPYKIGVQSYKYIKAMNLVSKAPAVRHVKEVEKKLEKNSKTVQSPQAYDKRPMAQAFKLTEAQKSQLYEEMTSCARYASSVPEQI